MEHRAPICLVAELQEAGGSLRVQGRELPGHGAARMHHHTAQKVFMRWLLVTSLSAGMQGSRRRFVLRLRSSRSCHCLAGISRPRACGRAGRSPVTCVDRLPVLSPSPAPAAPTKRTLEGSRGSCLPPWSPCSLPRSRSVRHGLLCGGSCPEAPPMRQSRLSPSPPSAREPRSVRRSSGPYRRAPPEALCHCSASTLLPRLQRFLRAFIVPRIGREHAWCSP